MHVQEYNNKNAHCCMTLCNALCAPVPRVSGHAGWPAGCTSVQVKAMKLSSSLTQNSDELVVLKELSLNTDTPHRDKNPLPHVYSVH